MTGLIILVRHGRTMANAAGVLLGRLDPPLDPLGEAQSAAAAAAIGPVDRVISSPLLRARQTAEQFGVEAELDERWIELDYGAWDGVAVHDLPPGTWEQWRRDVDLVPPGGESLRTLGSRVREACAELAASAADQTIVVVTHVSPVKAAIAWALGVGDEVAWRTFVAPASLTRIRPGPTGPTLVGFNEVAHLAALSG